MIKPNEIRIGNLFHKIDRNNAIHLPSDKIYKITRIGSYVFAVDEKENPAELLQWTKIPYSDLSPIPITEQILIEFGFEYRDYDHMKDWYIGINPVTKDWFFHISWLKEPETIRAPNCPFYRNGGHPIYYVHQLQNLFYFLCGEELKKMQ